MVTKHAVNSIGPSQQVLLTKGPFREKAELNASRGKAGASGGGTVGNDTSIH